MRANIKPVIASFLLAILPTILVWLPFFLGIKSFWTIPIPEQGMATIVANFDGPLYLVAAKTLYNPAEISKNFQFPLSNEYYSAHFPMFPILIRIFSPLFGYPYSMLFITIFFSFLSIYFFYKHAVNLVDKKNALWLTTVFAIFPARWLIVRSVGSAEPLFVSAILASSYYFAQKKYLSAGVWGMIAQMTKSPGILLFIAYLIQIVFDNFKLLLNTNIFKFKYLKNIKILKIFPIIFIPLGLIAVFTFYGFVYKDFWVYFKSGDNIHLFFPPFQIFNYSAPWVGTFWLEEIIFVYLVSILGIFNLKKMNLNTYFYFTTIFFASLIFVSHRDILRYSIPIVPFLILSFKDLLIKAEFKIALMIITIPIYLYSLAFISQNTMPIANWAPFL